MLLHGERNEATPAKNAIPKLILLIDGYLFIITLSHRIGRHILFWKIREGEDLYYLLELNYLDQGAFCALDGLIARLDGFIRMDIG